MSPNGYASSNDFSAIFFFLFVWMMIGEMYEGNLPFCAEKKII